MSIRTKQFLYSLIPLALLLAGALALRLVFFTGIVRYDDLNNAHYAFDAMRGQLYFGTFGYAGWRSALYLPVALIYTLFGITEFNTVAYPIFTSLLGIGFVYGIGRLMANETAGLIAAFFWMLFPVEVHFASDLLPDVPMTAFSTGAVFFFMLGRQQKSPNSILAYGASAFCIVWAILTKAWAIATLFFLAGLILLIFIQKNADTLKQLWAKAKKPITIIVIGISFAVAAVYIALQPRPFFVMLLLTGHDILDLFTGETFLGTGNTEIFLILLPLFIVSIASLLINPKSKSTILLLWAIFAYAYLEWGQTRLRLLYVPITLDWKARNLLQLLVPFFIIAGIHVGKDLPQRFTYLLISILALLIPIAGWFAKSQGFAGNVDIAITIGLVIAISGALVSPFFAPRTKTHQVFTGIFLSGFALASLHPTPPYHFSDETISSQSEYRQAMNRVADFLLTEDDYPIFTFSDDTARDLNFASGFQLGHDWRGSKLPTPTQRIGFDTNVLEREESFYFVRYSDFSGVIPANWLLLQETGASLEKPIQVYRVLSDEDAAHELSAAEAKLQREASIENYERLYGAAVNAGDLSALLRAWTQLRNKNAQISSISNLASTVTELLPYTITASQENLLLHPDFSDDFSTWEHSQGIIVSQLDGSNGVSPTIRAVYPERLDIAQGIFREVALSPNTSYLLHLEVQSNIAAKILTVGDGKVEDSLNSGHIYEDWTSISVVFITPPWDGVSNEVKVELFTARQIGEVHVRNIALFEINP